jgi:hypothetical protein
MGIGVVTIGCDGVLMYLYLLEAPVNIGFLSCIHYEVLFE